MAVRRYDNVQALMICWEGQSISTFRRQRNELKNVFEEKYNFSGTELDIPQQGGEQAQQDPQVYLLKHLQDFKTLYNKKGNLLIVYYGGHGINGEGSELLWSRSVWSTLSFQHALLDRAPHIYLMRFADTPNWKKRTEFTIHVSGLHYKT